jgi:hypothetical protein
MQLAYIEVGHSRDLDSRVQEIATLAIAEHDIAVPVLVKDIHVALQHGIECQSVAISTAIVRDFIDTVPIVIDEVVRPFAAR